MDDEVLAAEPVDGDKARIADLENKLFALRLAARSALNWMDEVYERKVYLSASGDLTPAAAVRVRKLLLSALSISDPGMQEL